MRIRTRLIGLLVGVMSVGATVAMIPTSGAASAAREVPAAQAAEAPLDVTCEAAKLTGIEELIRLFCSS